jgi:hypothetical protein
MPKVFAESIVGSIPVFIESRMISMEAGRISAPKESLVSTSSRLFLKSDAICL